MVGATQSVAEVKELPEFEVVAAKAPNVTPLAAAAPTARTTNRAGTSRRPSKRLCRLPTTRLAGRPPDPPDLEDAEEHHRDHHEQDPSQGPGDEEQQVAQRVQVQD